MSKDCMNIDIVSSTISGRDGRISLCLTDENGETVAYDINISQASWLKHAIKHAIQLRKEK